MKPYCIQLTPLRMYARNSAAIPFRLHYPSQRANKTQCGDILSGLERSILFGGASGEADYAPSRPHQEHLDVTVGKDAQSGLERSDIGFGNLFVL
jgi:hypothetical protein